MTLGEALAVFKRNAQRFYPFIRDEKQWLKDGDAELGPFESWGEAKRYIAKVMRRNEPVDHRAARSGECLTRPSASKTG